MPTRSRRRPSPARLAALTLFPLALAIALAAAAITAAHAQASRPQGSRPPAAHDRYVAIISLDGFAAYSLNDPLVPVPTLRRLARAGVRAEGMIPVNPTVTWPNHTSIVTGVRPDQHSVLYNGSAVRGGEGEPLKVEAHVPKSELVRGTTLYDLAHQAGLTTAEVDWVAIEHAPTITWSFSEFARADGPVEKEMIAAGLVTDDEMRAFPKARITFRDDLWTRAAEHMVRTHKPNLLLFHLLTTDSAQHTYGARSLGGDTALSLADKHVARVIDAYRQAGILEKTTFVIVSDHGFKTFKKRIRPNALLKAKGMSGSAWVIPEGGTAMVYVTRAADKPKTIAALTEAFTGVEGVTRIVTPADFAALGYPSPEANTRMADLVLVAADGYAFDGTADGDAVVDVPAGSSPGSHGYLNTDPDMRAIFIASGAAVKAGVTLGVVENVDVAPTVARILGIEMPNVAGRVLVEVLREQR